MSTPREPRDQPCGRIWAMRSAICIDVHRAHMYSGALAVEPSRIPRFIPVHSGAHVPRVLNPRVRFHEPGTGKRDEPRALVVFLQIATPPEKETKVWGRVNHPIPVCPGNTEKQQSSPCRWTSNLVWTRRFLGDKDFAECA